MQLVKPKKSLGQHFLTDLSIAEGIADTLATHRDLPVLEVGPGMGVLTQFLLEKGHDLRVVELDSESVSYLKVHYPSSLDGRIIEADFLKLKLEEIFDGPFCLIGNYPYNISSQIFFKVVLLQVVKRITAPMGNEFITLVKDTALARALSVIEIIAIAYEKVNKYAVLTPLLYAGLFYLAFSGLLTLLFHLLEKKLSYYTV